MNEKKEIRKGMTVSVYRPARNGDSTNGGLSSKVGRLLLVGNGIPELVSECEEYPAIEIVARKIPGREKPYFTAYPYGESQAGLMFGGNFVYCSDSRFRTLYEYPVPIHDRIEH